MRIVTAFIDSFDKEYVNLLRAFEASCQLNSKIQLTVLRDTANFKTKVRAKINGNSQKLNLYNEYLKNNPQDDIVFMDCDMIVREDFSEVFDRVETIGYTFADYPRNIPFNGGFLVVKANALAHDQFDELTKINNRMVKQHFFHAPYRARYGGINQAAMGYMMEHGATWTALPMSIYNMCENWHIINSKVMHYKSKLRTALHAEKPPKPFMPLIREWWSYFDYGQRHNINRFTEIVSRPRWIKSVSPNLADSGPRTHADDPT